jgi:protein TonB
VLFIKTGAGRLHRLLCSICDTSKTIWLRRIQTLTRLPPFATNAAAATEPFRVGYTQPIASVRFVPGAAPPREITRRTPMSGAAVAFVPQTGRVVAGSALLHGLLIAAIVWRWAPAPPGPPNEGATVQVEYVNQSAAQAGVPNPDAAAAPAEDPAPGEAPSATAPAPPPDTFADVPMPPDFSQSDTATTQAGRPTSAPGHAATDREALTVTGRNLVSSGPDVAYRNMPPHFPREAVRAHQQGSVQVTIHITPSGLADGVETVISSGSAVLDNAVRDAVMKWHFKPAMRDGVAVASVYRLQMNFRNEAAP